MAEEKKVTKRAKKDTPKETTTKKETKPKETAAKKTTRKSTARKTQPKEPKTQAVEQNPADITAFEPVDKEDLPESTETVSSDASKEESQASQAAGPESKTAEQQAHSNAAQVSSELPPGAVPYMILNPPPLTCKAPANNEIQYDFNLGARISVPAGKYRIRIIDNDAHLILYDATTDPDHQTIVRSTKVYFVNFHIDVFLEDKLVFSHDFDAKDKKVLLKFPDTAIGDTLAWFPYAEEFRKKHGCEVYVAVSKRFRELLEEGYPNLHFIDQNEVIPDSYATYYVGLFAPWDNRDFQPVDWRVVGLQQHGAYLLGVEPKSIPPRIIPSDKKRTVKEPYVCISTQATGQKKYWNNAYGWIGVVEFLKKLGYRVICIDRDRRHANNQYVNSIPYGCEDCTGDKPLIERANLIANAEFFIGLSSGLSWVAWGVGVPVVMISGFTLPGTEFPTPYRVQQFQTCTGCANDTRNGENYKNFADCPKFGGTEREYECSRMIMVNTVTDVIRKLIENEGIDVPNPDALKEEKKEEEKA